MCCFDRFLCGFVELGIFFNFEPLLLVDVLLTTPLWAKREDEVQ